MPPNTPHPLFNNKSTAMPDSKQLLWKVYEAFNARELDEVQHLYQLRDGHMASMEIRDAAASGSKTA